MGNGPEKKTMKLAMQTLKYGTVPPSEKLLDQEETAQRVTALLNSVTYAENDNSLFVLTKLFATEDIVRFEIALKIYREKGDDSLDALDLLNKMAVDNEDFEYLVIGYEHGGNETLNIIYSALNRYGKGTEEFKEAIASHYKELLISTD